MLDSERLLQHPQEALTEIAPLNKIAIYDMDRTITVRGTYAAFLRFMVPRIAPWRVMLLPLLLFTSAGYACGLVSRQRLKESNFRILLGPGINTQQHAPLLDDYAAQVLQNNIRPLALRQIAQDSGEGWHILFATASFAFYVEPIAARLGIEAKDVIATRLHPGNGGVFLAHIMGKNCYGADKLVHVQHWMAEQGIDRDQVKIRFYSDHVSDAPCLHYADVAIATTPHPPLRAYAAKQRWTIVDW